jgi:hypothetical protein
VLLHLCALPAYIPRLFSDGGPPPRPNLPHGTVLGVAPSGVIGYNCNYDNFPELSEGEVFDQQTCAPPPLVRHDFAKLKTNVVYRYVKDSKGRLTFSGMKWQVAQFICFTSLSAHTFFAPFRPAVR